MKQICELNGKIILGQDGLSSKVPQLIAFAIVKNQDGLYAVIYADKFNLQKMHRYKQRKAFQKIITTTKVVVCTDPRRVITGFTPKGALNPYHRITRPTARKRANVFLLKPSSITLFSLRHIIPFDFVIMRSPNHDRKCDWGLSFAKAFYFPR